MRCNFIHNESIFESEEEVVAWMVRLSGNYKDEQAASRAAAASASYTSAAAFLNIPTTAHCFTSAAEQHCTSAAAPQVHNEVLEEQQSV